MSRRNPNGYGSVTKLKGKRSRPWMIRATIYDADGNGKQVTVDYAATEEEANIILAQYNNNPWNIDRNKVTLAELYKRWSAIKLPKLGNSSQRNMRAGYNHLEKYYGMKYRQIRAYHMQDSIDNCGLSYAMQSIIKNLWGHLDRFAFECDIIDKMYSQLTTAPPVPETSKKPFTYQEVESLWKIKDQPYVSSVLIFLYTGFRLNELLGMKTDQVNLEDQTFKGGSKSTSGKNRVIPIHPRILPLVEELVSEGNPYLISFHGKRFVQSVYYNYWNPIMKQIGVNHTPHEARHTFRSRLDSAGANKKCIDMLMGHKSKDVGERVYTHKSLQELRDTILLLK